MEKFKRSEPEQFKRAKFEDDDFLSDGETFMWACAIGAVMFILFEVV